MRRLCVKDPKILDIKTAETYVPLSRGLLEHLNRFTPSELKTFIFLLLNAYFKGENKGKCFFKLENLAAELEIDKRTASTTLNKLQSKGYILYKPRSNQWTFNAVTIIKYKNTGDFRKNHKFAMDTNINSNKDNTKVAIDNNINSNKAGENSAVPKISIAMKQQGNSKQHNSNNSKGLRIFNNDENGKNDVCATFEDLKKFLEKLHNKKINLEELRQLSENKGFKDPAALVVAMAKVLELLPVNENKQDAFNRYSNPLRFWEREKELPKYYKSALREIREKQEQVRRRKEDVERDLKLLTELTFLKKSFWKSGKYIEQELKPEEITHEHIELSQRNIQRFIGNLKWFKVPATTIDKAINEGKERVRKKYGASITNRIYENIYVKS